MAWGSWLQGEGRAEGAHTRQRSPSPARSQGPKLGHSSCTPKVIPQGCSSDSHSPLSHVKGGTNTHTHPPALCQDPGDQHRLGSTSLKSPCPAQDAALCLLAIS